MPTEVGTKLLHWVEVRGGRKRRQEARRRRRADVVDGMIRVVSCWNSWKSFPSRRYMINPICQLYTTVHQSTPQPCPCAIDSLPGSALFHALSDADRVARRMFGGGLRHLTPEYSRCHFKVVTTSQRRDREHCNNVTSARVR